MSAALLIPIGRTFPLVRKLNVPVDFGVMLGQSRLVGPSRTFLGLIVAILVGIIWLSVSDDSYALIKTLLAFVGVVLASFIKRRLNLKQGAPFLIADQIDYLLLVAAVFYICALENIFVLGAALIITAIAHPIVCYVAYKLHLKESPF